MKARLFPLRSNEALGHAAGGLQKL
jgi:hypothetical protein